MSTIAITGVGGSLGRRLVGRLAAHVDVERVVGLDRNPPQGVNAPRFTFHDADPGTAALDGVLTGVDAVIHLGGLLDPARGDAAQRVRQVDGARHVIEAAGRVGVPRVVLTSSVLAYGAHPDNDVPLSEDSELRGLPGFAAAEHAREVERWVATWRERNPATAVAVLRLALLAGPDLDTMITRSFEAPRIPVVRGHRPPMQFLHPDDAVEAIVHAITAELDGTFNVCADGWLSYDEVIAIVGRRSLEVPEEVAYSGAAGVYALGLGDLPPGSVSLFVHPCVMTNAALTETGWRPRYSNRDALAALAAEHAPYVTIGRVRTRRATLWRSAMVAVALVTFGTWRAVRAHRGRRADSPPT
ncbi:MAG: NAD-dependent epimerase/dehydratase family protein [Nitriliruptoraceae bacterium]